MRIEDAHEGRAQCAKQAEVSPMRAKKETAQPVAAIAADEPSEAGSISSELCERREATMLNCEAGVLQAVRRSRTTIAN